MATHTSSELALRVARDAEAFGPPTLPSPAITALGRLTGARLRERRRPYHLVAHVAEVAPYLFQRLSHEQRASLATMMLARVLVQASPELIIDGGRLQLEWDRLPAAAKALCGEQTDAAVKRLAALADSRQVQLPTDPSRFAKALLVDGSTVRWLANGCLSEEPE